ncbi:MAG: acyl-CoA thioesterase [Planctomycetes bacterium]|nr:acyl-CoA thioesterase [Planctomycetota bacterium]
MSDKKNPTLRVTLLPKDTNRLGTIFGGVILSYIDLSAAIEARRSCGNHKFVTVAMDRVVFHAPVFVGDVVSFYATTLKKGRTSVTVRVSVESERQDELEVVPVTEAELVFVAIGEDRRPIAIQGESKT